MSTKDHLAGYDPPLTVLVVLARSSSDVAPIEATLRSGRDAAQGFGRHALGATRLLIVALLTIQVGVLATTGALLGVAASLLWLGWTGNPQPTAVFVAAVAIAAVLTAGVAALPPALYAARRDPLHELWVP